MIPLFFITVLLSQWFQFRFIYLFFVGGETFVLINGASFYNICVKAGAASRLSFIRCERSNRRRVV
jgi:hypothetical protein